MRPSTQDFTIVRERSYTLKNNPIYYYFKLLSIIAINKERLKEITQIIHKYIYTVIIRFSAKNWGRIWVIF